MKRTFPLLLMACGVANLCAARDNSERWSIREEENINKTMTLSGEPARVVIDNIDGYVHVTGTSGSEVRVTAHKTIRAESDADTQEAKREVSLQMTEKPGSVSVYYDAPWRCNEGRGNGCHGQQRHFYNVTYDIDVQVPREARLVISTVNNGDVRVESTGGDFDVSDINGGIKMKDVKGSGDVHTINGPVTVAFAQNPHAACSFKSINGQLEVFFQPALSADLMFKTFNGQIYTDFDVTARATPAAATERREGKYVYRSNRMQGGRAGQGGPELSFDTLNGSIRLHSTTSGVSNNE